MSQEPIPLKPRVNEWLWECNDCLWRWLLSDDTSNERCPKCGSCRTEAADGGAP